MSADGGLEVEKRVWGKEQLWPAEWQLRAGIAGWVSPSLYR